jgi:hypothetical protein
MNRMLQEFFRLAVYVPVDEAGQGADLAAVSAAAVREILRTFRDFGFAGSVGTYQAVVEISSAVETFMPTADSAPTHGAAGIVSAVPSARLVTYIPAGTPREEVDRLVGAVASIHPWEHPLIELDRVSLWMPAEG